MTPFEILCPDDKCPICSKDLIHSLFSIDNYKYCHFCENECFVYWDYKTHASIKIFKDKFFLNIMGKTIMVFDKIEDVQNKINFWLEDYKYVAEILEKR